MRVEECASLFIAGHPINGDHMVCAREQRGSTAGYL